MSKESTNPVLKWVLIAIIGVTIPCAIFVLYAMIYPPDDYRVVKELRARGFVVEYKRHDGSIKQYLTHVYREGLVLTPDDCRLICQLPRLKVLGFAGSDLSGLDLDDIGNCSELGGLICIGVKQFPVAEIRKLTACPIRHMVMQGVHLKDSDLEYFAGLTQLVSLVLNNNAGITDASFEHLEKFASLKWLSISETSVTKEGVEEFQKKRPDVNVLFE